MTRADWIAKAKANEAALLALVRDFHPGMATFRRRHRMPITAPNAEGACEVVRNHIAQREMGESLKPDDRLQKAIEEGDVSEVMSVLDGAWFGVPESTSCWQLEGFSTAVDLLEDLPEEMG